MIGAEKPIDQLRGILAKAAARDEELRHALEAFAGDLLKELGADDPSPIWAELEAAKGERQVSPYLAEQIRQTVALPLE